MSFAGASTEARTLSQAGSSLFLSSAKVSIEANEPETASKRNKATFIENLLQACYDAVRIMTREFTYKGFEVFSDWRFED